MRFDAAEFTLEGGYVKAIRQGRHSGPSQSDRRNEKKMIMPLT